jgi:pSer/pThr/pTyr-binding forkhead associated (FHA) protein
MPDQGVQSAADLKQQIEAERAGVPFLVYRDAKQHQHLFLLSDELERITVGRGSSSDIWLDWDSEVSRVHAELGRTGDSWTVADDGLSRNGSYVNGERVLGRRRLLDGDVLRIGSTLMTFRQPQQTTIAETSVAADGVSRASVSDAQRRVLVALCRPFKDSNGYVTPATNQQIADELFLSIDAVKTHLRALFGKFEVEDLPQNQKRVRLVELALKNGIVSPRDL